MSAFVDTLVAHFQIIYRDRMQGLPIVNPAIHVEAVGFSDWQEHELGVLITPWFMNLLISPGSEEWAGAQQGDLVACQFPSGECEMTVCDDETLGRYLSAVLFRTMADFPDQSIARAVAAEALTQMLSDPPPAKGRISRRDVFTGVRAT